MKIKLTVCGIILLAILAAALYLRFGGVTHERTVRKSPVVIVRDGQDRVLLVKEAVTKP